MKLLNRTKIPDDILEAVLIPAGRIMKARTSNVVVQVNPGRHCGGTAYDCTSVNWTGNRSRKRRWIKTDEGAFKITLPTQYLRRDPLAAAVDFFEIARHEWHHIREFQSKDCWRLDWSRRRKGRRPNWKDRPEEIRCENACYDAEKRGDNAERFADEILELAIALNRIYKVGTSNLD